MHGVAGVMHGSCIDKLDLSEQVLKQAMAHVMTRVGAGLAAKL
jgi:hypothetical protein